MKPSNIPVRAFGDLIRGMRTAYANGENAMNYARIALNADLNLPHGDNLPLATLIAYDLQAGTYVARAKANPSEHSRWCQQIANLLDPLLPTAGSLLEVGVGEATTLAGVLRELPDAERKAIGFDISWSRIAVARDWIKNQNQEAELFVGDLFHIPLA